ncbi:MAG TPA: nicotinate-nucleotide--dimethylbenzimidazole phosphoribosyltransferase [Acidimicrobiia bacterium]|nr:nicotinate-nucleotide--dimethylbenzimidazole phosphoribosyltransferase [Acidimicrobiia bacterium]
MVIASLVADLERAPAPDELHRQAVVQRAARTLRPPGAFSRLDPLAAWLAAWQRTDVPAVAHPALVLAASDHGVVSRGVTSYPSTVTAAMVDAIRAGVATSAVLAERLGVTLRLVDAGVGHPTADIVEADALSLERFEHLVTIGRRTVAELNADLVAVGEMGIGNTTATAAVAAALYGGDTDAYVGRGAGLDDSGMEVKRQVVRDAVARVGQTSPLEVLRRLGGAEHAVLMGVVAEARLRSIPVLLDGYVTSVVAAVMHAVVAGSTEHCLAAHLSTEPGHRLVLDRLGMTPLLDLGMGLGEGSGALVALPIVRLAAAAVVDVATFEEWGLA